MIQPSNMSPLAEWFDVMGKMLQNFVKTDLVTNKHEWIEFWF